MASFDDRLRSAYNQRKKKEEEESKKSSSSKSSDSKTSTNTKTTTVSSSKTTSVDDFDDRLRSAYQQRKKEWAEKAKGVDKSFINTFISDARKYIDTVQDDYDKADYNTTSSIYNSRYQSSRDLRERADKIRSYLKTQGNYDGEVFSFIDNFI